MSPNHLDPEFIQAERKAKRFWVSLVVAFLGAQVVIGMVSYHLATRDSSVAVVPNYHANALDWDSHHRQSTAADRLGIDIQVKVSEVADGNGLRAISIKVVDPQKQPVSGLDLTANLYHHSDANHVQAITFTRAGEGAYQSLPPMAKPGVWQIDLHVEGADEAMTKSVTLNVAS